ncbi:MAG: chemotaxis protein CheA [Polyangiaceae bacterium]
MAEAGDRAREEFFSETQEIVEGLNRDLLALDDAQRTGRAEPELVNDIFRAVHTLKGLAGLFGASRISTLSHELEDLLDKLRLGKVDLSAEVLDVLFKSVDLYSRLLQAEKAGTEAPGAEVDELVRSVRGATGGGTTPSPFGQYDLDPGLLAVLTEYEEHRLRTNIAQGLSLFRLRVVFALATIDQALDDLKSLAKPMGEIITYLPTGSGADADSIELDILIASRAGAEDLSRALAGKGVSVEEIPRHAGAPPPAPVTPPRTPIHSIAPPPESAPDSEASSEVEMARAPDSEGAQASAARNASAAHSLRSVAQTVRVDIHKLNRLMNIVGELAIVRTQLARLVERLRASQSDRSVTTDLHRLQRTFDRHLGTMQQGILEVRMVPLGQVFDKLARIVRQISREADKSVNLVITGAETEVDKLIVEELSDPLMHMMRNAIDHGIESKVDRQIVGKPEMGTIALNAFQKGSHVVIEIEDDGRGVDTDTLLTAAVRRGVVTQEEAHQLSPREVLNLVFLPGLTTKANVSEISGRGVGMDVVKTNIAKLGGVIDLTSEAGIGTKFTVTLPITLAIIPALMVRCSDRLFAIPLANVQEAVVLDVGSVREIDGREMITLRGVTLPLCSLSRLFDLPPPAVEGGDLAAESSARAQLPASGSVGISSAKSRWGNVTRTGARSLRQFIVVTSVGSRRLGIVVESLVGEQDVVIKALGPSLKGVKGFAGATELGDQRIALVLDVQALVEETLASGDRRGFELKGGHG